MNDLKLEVRETLESDVEGVISLFCENGENPYNWSIEKWKHYYLYYPEGEPISFVATIRGKIIGHYGMLPVRIGRHCAMMGLHAYIAADQRGLAVISALMKEVDLKCKKREIALICGFANPNFSIVKTTIFKWKIVCWLGFQKGIDNSSMVAARSKKYYFSYSPRWYSWRFGALQNEYVSRYIDPQGNMHKQLLKTTKNTCLDKIAESEGWSPISTYPKNRVGQLCQPFSIKVFDEHLINEGILNHNNWKIEMGDSDTFHYTPWDQIK